MIIRVDLTLRLDNDIALDRNLVITSDQSKDQIREIMVTTCDQLKRELVGVINSKLV